MNVAVWLGSTAPLRSVRWLDGALATAKKLGEPTAIAAGPAGWLELASDRAMRAGVQCVGLATELKLDYLGWAQIVAAIVRELGLDTVLVDEASRPERFGEVAAIADLLDVAQVTRVVALGARGSVLNVKRALGREVQSIRVRGPGVFGVRIPGAPVEEHATPVPSAALKRFDLADLGLDAIVLGHRAVTPRSSTQPKKTVERITDHISVHMAPRRTS